MMIIRMIDAELRLLSVYRRLCVEDGWPVGSTRMVDGLLDERAACSRANASDRPDTMPEKPRSRVEQMLAESQFDTQS